MEADLSVFETIDETTEVHPAEVLAFVQLGWKPIMTYPRTRMVQAGQYLDGQYINTPTPVQETIVLLGRTPKEKLTHMAKELVNLQGITTKITTELREKSEALKVAVSNVESKDKVIMRYAEEIKTLRSQIRPLEDKCRKMESDIGKIRSAIGSQAMDKILNPSAA